jgi:hypothetical protein
MRVFQAVSLGAAAVILTGSVATAQSLADAAAREREKRKGKTQGTAKVINEEELRKAGGTVASPAATEAGTVSTGATSTTATTPGQGDAAAGAKAPAADEKSPDQIKAEQMAAWRQKLDLARKQVAVYQDLIKALQADLNDMSGGVYTPRRAAAQTNLEKTQGELSVTQQTVADLEAEGRRNGFN